MNEKLLEFVCMHMNKTFFLFFCIFKFFEEKQLFLISNQYLIVYVYSFDIK